MRRALERLFAWCGRRLYGADWPPVLILVLRQTTPIDETELKEPKVFH